MLRVVELDEMEIRRQIGDLNRHLGALSELKAGIEAAQAGLSEQIADLELPQAHEHLRVMRLKLELLSKRERGLYQLADDIAATVRTSNQALVEDRG